MQNTMTLKEAIESFEQRLRAEGKSKHTVASYLRDTRLLLRHFGVDSVMSDISKTRLLEFAASDTILNQADGRPRSSSTVNKIRASIRAFFTHLTEIGVYDESPADILRLRAHRPKPPAILTAAEQKKLLDTVAGEDSTTARRDHLIFALALGTGLRLGSLTALDIEDLRLGEGGSLPRSRAAISPPFSCAATS